MNFEASSHRERWLFDEQTLAAERAAARAAALGGGKHTREATPACGGGDAAAQPDAKKQRDAPVAPDEEALVRRLFEANIRALCEAYPLAPKVTATAVSYFKRFYVRRSMLEHDPSRIAPTCIYLAAKVEEAYVGAEDFCRQLKIDPQLVLRTEVPVLQGLGFDLVVHSPYRALAGLLQELESLRAAGAPGAADPQLLAAPQEAVQKLTRAANRAVGAILASDAPLLFPPGALALAALRSGARAAGLGVAGFVEHAAARAAAVAAQRQQEQQQQEQQRQQEAERGAAGGGGALDSARPVPARLVVSSDPGAALQQLLGWMGEVDALVAAAMREDEGLQERAGDVDRRIKLWRKAQGAGGGGASGGGAVAAADGSEGGGVVAAT